MLTTLGVITLFLADKLYTVLARKTTLIAILEIYSAPLISGIGIGPCHYSKLIQTDLSRASVRAFVH